MPRLPIRLLLCLSSYAPLFFIVALRALGIQRAIAITFAGLAVVSLASLYLFLWAHSRRARILVRFTEVQQRDGDVMGYVVTYLVPFLGTTFYSAGSFDVANAVSMGLLFTVIIVIYVNANLIFINPVLSLVGYHIYEIEMADSAQKKALLTRRTSLPSSGALDLISLGSFVFWDPGK